MNLRIKSSFFLLENFGFGYRTRLNTVRTSIFTDFLLSCLSERSKIYNN